MRAYLILPPGAAPDAFGSVDALVVDGRSPSLRAGGEAIQSQRPAVADPALDRFASLAMTEAGTGPGKPRLLVRVEGIEAPDLDACLAGLAALCPDAIVLPARHGRDVAHLGARLAVLEAEHGLPDGGIGIVALVTCATGVLAADTFVDASARLRGLGWDAAALARQLGMPLGHASAGSASPPLPQDEGMGGAAGVRPDPWASLPVLAHARAVVRLAAAAAGVEAIETAYPGADSEQFGAHAAVARRDGFGAMVARDPAQAAVIRGGT